MSSEPHVVSGADDSLKGRARSQAEASAETYIWSMEVYNDALEWLTEPESHPIRSAMKFCLDLDVRTKKQLF